MGKNLKLPITKTFAASEELVRRIDDYRRRQDRLPTEGGAIRTLLEQGLTSAASGKPSVIGRGKAQDPAVAADKRVPVERSKNLPKMKAFAASHELVDRIADYRRGQDPIPSESEAIRRLLEIGLAGAEIEPKKTR